MNILGMISGFDGCGLFRMQIPFKYLNKQNINAKISFIYSKEDLEWADIVVVQKQYQDQVVPYVNLAKKLKKPVLLEFDDLMTDIPTFNPAHKFYEFKKDKIVRFINLCDGLTVSTEYLKTVHAGLNSNTYVLPNSIDMPVVEGYKNLSTLELNRHTIFRNPRDINEVLPQDEVLNKLKNKVKLMWWGSPTHQEDLKVIDKTLARLCYENSELFVVKMGCCTQEFLDYMGGCLDQLVVIDPVPVHHFHKVLYSIIRLGPTIVACPIVDLPFNRAKSNLKIIEAFSNKAIVMASNVENYRMTINNGVNGLLVSNKLDEEGIAFDWYKKLSELIKDSTQQKLLSENGYLTVKNHYNIETNVQLWVEAYKNILEKV